MALANLAPENPCLLPPDSLALGSHFLSFNGLIRLASVLWLFWALAGILVACRSNLKPGGQGVA